MEFTKPVKNYKQRGGGGISNVSESMRNTFAEYFDERF